MVEIIDDVCKILRLKKVVVDKSEHHSKWLRGLSETVVEHSQCPCCPLCVLVLCHIRFHTMDANNQMNKNMFGMPFGQKDTILKVQTCANWSFYVQ